jgi:hypothetical protein
MGRTKMFVSCGHSLWRTQKCSGKKLAAGENLEYFERPTSGVWEMGKGQKWA